MSASATITDRSAGEALGLWEPKRALTLEAARAHTRRIRVLRYILMGAAGLLLLALIAQFLTDRGGIEFDDNPSESVKMVNPRYSGRTEDGLPFYLTADTATRTLADKNAVALVNPVLEFIRDEGVASSFVVAKTGSYNDMEKILDLRTAVNLETDDGYVCNTTHARIFARDKRIEGDEPIACQGSFGAVDGTTYAIEDNYKTFIFKDGMTALINEESAPTADADDDFGFSGDGPINIAAVKGTYRGAETQLEGDVNVVQDEATLTSNLMDIFRRDKGETGTGSLKLGAIDRIDAQGDFHYVSAENDIRGGRGVYERDKKIMTVTDNVKVVQPGGNTVEAQSLIYDTANRAVRYSGNCQGRDCAEGGRTKTVISGSGN